jgi:hypothetical protein
MGVEMLERTPTVDAMSETAKHEHRTVTEHALASRRGVPYEVVRTTCEPCRRVLAERPLRRAAA